MRPEAREDGEDMELRRRTEGRTEDDGGEVVLIGVNN